MSRLAKSRRREFLTRMMAAWGIEESALTYPMRRLQLAGILPTGGRGYAGEAMTALSMTDVMIAAAVTQRPLDPVEVWTRYSNVAAVYSQHRMAPVSGGIVADVDPVADDGGAFHLPGFFMPTLQALGAGHSFRDALAALIQAAGDQEISNAKHADHPDADVYYTLDVTIGGPRPSANITLNLSGLRPDGSVAFHYRELADYLLEEGGGGPDLRISRTFTHHTIDEVASLLRA